MCTGVARPESAAGSSPISATSKAGCAALSKLPTAACRHAPFAACPHAALRAARQLVGLRPAPCCTEVSVRSVSGFLACHEGSRRLAESEPQKGEALPTSEGFSPSVPTSVGRRPKRALSTDGSSRDVRYTERVTETNRRSSVSLYRKWRPRAFSGIVGQDAVVRTLRRAIETDRVSHAYLFSGPRGTGKTSTAKVLAMGLNCEKGPTAEPDGTCESCRAIVGNSSLDVLEMDAASNRGIDEIRDLRDKVNLAPASGRVKVYIIDEVHMLTAEAFNALLKMLEEPPEHVVFVLATTEKHKVLPTIISRCQSFDFRRPSVETLVGKLQEICEAEDIEVDPEALTVIAREGRGSFRDAEGLLDQLSSFSEGSITASMVRELLGGVGPEALVEVTYALSERKAADALLVVDRLSNEGKDLGQFVGELLAHLRTLMLLPHAPEVALAGVGTEERVPLEKQADAVPTAEVVRLVDALGLP